MPLNELSFLRKSFIQKNKTIVINMIRIEYSNLKSNFFGFIKIVDEMNFPFVMSIGFIKKTLFF